MAFSSNAAGHREHGRIIRDQNDVILGIVSESVCASTVMRLGGITGRNRCTDGLNDLQVVRRSRPCPRCASPVPRLQEPYLRHRKNKEVDSPMSWTDEDRSELLEEARRKRTPRCPNDGAVVAVQRQPVGANISFYLSCPACGAHANESIPRSDDRFTDEQKRQAGYRRSHVKLRPVFRRSLGIPGR